MLEKTLFCQIRTTGMWGRRRHGSETFFEFPDLNSASGHLTFAWVASLDVSGDADNCQGVDAHKAEEQSEETIYLEENKEKGWWSTWLFQTCALSFIFLFLSCYALYQIETEQLPSSEVLQDQNWEMKTFIIAVIRFILIFIQSIVCKDYFLIMALDKGNYATGIQSASNCVTPSTLLCHFQVMWIS